MLNTIEELNIWSEFQWKRKLFNDMESINIVAIYIQDTLAASFLIKPLVRVINNTTTVARKESSLSPPGGFHTQKSSTIHRSPATGEIKP